jgi:uncharacterized LabA/DUF88 family protein
VTERSFAVLLDGGFLKYALKQKREDGPISPELVQSFVDSIGKLPSLAGAKLHRIYYYDAKPLTGTHKGPLGKSVDFSGSELYKISTNQHRSFTRLPYFAMRYGDLSYKGWYVTEKAVRSLKAGSAIKAEHLAPNVQQKGVDMRIGLDIATLSLKRQVTAIVLVTGDSDLVPAMKLARREGTQLILVTLAGKLKDAMYEHADLVIEDKSWITYPTVDAASDAASSDRNFTT